MALLDDGVAGRVELATVLDVCTYSIWLGWVGRSGSRGCLVVEAGEEAEECGVDLCGTLLLPACWAWLKTVWKPIGSSPTR